MNHYNAAILLRNDVVTVQVVHYNSGRVYTYVAEKSLADWLDQGTPVVVRNSRGFTVGVVERVDDDLEIDVDADFSYCWIIQRVDDEYADRLYDECRQIAKELDKRKAESYRNQMLAALGITQEEAQRLVESRNGSTDG